MHVFFFEGTMDSPGPTQSITYEEEVGKETTSSKKGWIKYIVAKSGHLWMNEEDKKEWLNYMRGNLSLIATVISTMTFQMAFNPPGGVRPVKETGNDIPCLPDEDNGDDPKLCPGEAVLAIIYPNDYHRFLISNTICFVVSLSICLLLVSGIRLHHRLPMWMLAIGMCITLTSLALSYITALQMSTPDPVFEKANKFLEKLVFTWIGLLSILGLCLTIRLVI